MESSGSKENKGSNMEKMKRSSNKELKYSTDVLAQLYEHILLDKINKINIAWCIPSLATNNQIK